MPSIPIPSPEFRVTRQMYLDQFGASLVANTYLVIAVIALSLVALGSLLFAWRVTATAKNTKPVIVRINDIGRAEAISYDAGTYTPRDAECKYFLVQFVTKFYSRSRATIRQDWPHSLYFLDARLTAGLMNEARKTRFIETFQASQAEEVDVNVTRIAIQDLRTPPYHATVDYEKLFYTPSDRTLVRRERYAGNFVFIVRDTVPNELIPHNPLGLTITYFREDQAFQ